MSYLLKVAQGQRVMADLFHYSSSTLDAISDVLLDRHDEAIKCAMFFARHKRFPAVPADLDQPELGADLKEIKTACREAVQAAIDEAEKAGSAKKREAFEAARHAPGEAGTTAEVAARLGISKAEARRRRAAAMR